MIFRFVFIERELNETECSPDNYRMLSENSSATRTSRASCFFFYSNDSTNPTRLNGTHGNVRYLRVALVPDVSRKRLFRVFLNDNSNRYVKRTRSNGLNGSLKRKTALSSHRRDYGN